MYYAQPVTLESDHVMVEKPVRAIHWVLLDVVA